MKTTSQRKHDERERKRASGLLLKQVWVPPALWPAIRDLTTSEAESFVFAGPYTTTTSEEHLTSFAYGVASEVWAEITLQALATQQSDPHAFALQVLRAMMKTIPAPFTPTKDQIAAAKRAVFQEDATDED